jgi:MFS family permease
MARNSPLRRLTPIYLLLILRNTAWSLSVSGPVLPLYVRSLGVEIVDWGLLATAHAVGLIIFEGLWGTVSDRVDRRWMLVAAILCMGLVFPLYALHSLVPWFFALQFAIGAFACAVGPTTRAIVADTAPAGSKGFYMGLWFTFFILGSTIGPVLGAYISEAWGYEYAFHVSSILLLATAIVFSLSLRNGSLDGLRPARMSLPFSEALRVLFANPSVRLAFVLAVSIFMGISAVRSFLPIYASEQLGMSDVAIGAMVAISSATQLVATPFAGRFSDRFGERRLIAVGLAGLTVLYAVYSVIEDPLGLVAVTIGVSVLLSVCSLTLAFLSKTSPRELSGMAMGIYGCFEDLGLIVGPIIYGYIWSAYRPPDIFLASAAASALGLLFLTRIRDSA